MESDTDSRLANTIAAIVARHGLRTHTWTRLASLGSTMTIFLLDDLYVVRIPRNQPEAIAGIQSDPIVIPVVRRAGVRTPQLIAFDNRCDLLPVPYGVYEQVRGQPLDRLALPRDATPEIWQALGHDLALLHSGVTPHGPAGQIAANNEIVDALPWLDEITASARITSAERLWFAGWLDQLAPFVQLPITPRFCHGDVNAGNIIVDPITHEYRALLDWGGAFWGDATWDFAPVSLLAVPDMLAGYRPIARLDNDASAEARILWHHVVFTIFGLWKEQRRGPDWARERIGHLRQNMDRFLATRSACWIANLAP